MCTAIANSSCMFEMPWIANEMSPTDLIRPGRKGDGLLEAHYVDLGRVTHAVLAAWVDSVQLDEQPDGIMVEARSALGRELLAALEIADGSRILAINDLLTKGNATTGDPTAGDPGGTLWEAVMEVDRVINTGGVVVLILEDPEGHHHARYIVTSPGSRPGLRLCSD